MRWTWKKESSLKARVVYYLRRAINTNESNCVSQCESTKDIWRLLEIIHEETNQIKESRINILVHIYELFSMNDNESIVKMFIRFIGIINGLQALGKTSKELKKVMKILRYLPKKIEAKVTII